MKELKEYYQSRVLNLSDEISRLKQYNRYFIAGEIFSFALMIAFIVLYTLISNPEWTLYLAAGMLFAYIAIRRHDIRNSERIYSLECLKTVYEKEIKYMNGDFSCFDNGERYSDAHHPFTFDMDIFGHESLYNRINRTITTGGSDRLADIMKYEHRYKDTLDVDNINLRRDAINELANMEQWRSHFVSLGLSKSGIIDSTAIIKALNDVKNMKIPSFANHYWAFALAWMSIIGFFASVLLSIFTSLSANIPLWWGVLQFFAVFLLCSKPLRMINKAVSVLHVQIKAYIKIIKFLSAAEFKSEVNRSIVSELEDSVCSFDKLEKTLKGLDRRSNVLGLVVFNIMFLSDFFLVRGFLKWQNQYMGRIKQWIDSVSEADALVSLGTFRYNEPNAVNAEIVSEENMVYEAEGLYHPFIGDKAIRNDFRIDDGNYYIITGANMAGKSTFLRSLGVNYILAMNGMPVFADKLRISVFSMFSCMRTTDDLTRGISYFNAELLRLKQLIKTCRMQRKTLIILDEVLKGTNSLDKLNGSRLFLKTIKTLPASGIIATHDLELSKMSDEYPDVFHNYCFEIELLNEITYTYKITPGVARNQNATFLLKNIIKEGGLTYEDN